MAAFALDYKAGRARGWGKKLRAGSKPIAASGQDKLRAGWPNAGARQKKSVIFPAMRGFKPWQFAANSVLAP